MNNEIDINHNIAFKCGCDYITYKYPYIKWDFSNLNEMEINIKTIIYERINYLIKHDDNYNDNLTDEEKSDLNFFHSINDEELVGLQEFYALIHYRIYVLPNKK
jgi:hypothetical protein